MQDSPKLHLLSTNVMLPCGLNTLLPQTHSATQNNPQNLNFPLLNESKRQSKLSIEPEGRGSIESKKGHFGNWQCNLRMSTWVIHVFIRVTRHC